MAKTYIDSFIQDDECHRQKKLLGMQLESLIIPKINADRDTGKLIYNLPKTWQKANASERSRLVLSMLDAVHIETKNLKSIAATIAEPPFRHIFQLAVSKKNANILILDKPLKVASQCLRG